MPPLRDWLFAFGVGCAAGATYWVLYPLPGLIWRAIVLIFRSLPRRSQ